MPYDLLIKGGHVLDPGQGLDGHLDIGISRGEIAAIQPDIPVSEAARVLEIRSEKRYVVPGLIDLHTTSAMAQLRLASAWAVSTRTSVELAPESRPSSTRVRSVLPTLACSAPVQTIRHGEVFSTEWGPYAWGWLPESA